MYIQISDKELIQNYFNPDRQIDLRQIQFLALDIDLFNKSVEYEIISYSTDYYTNYKNYLQGIEDKQKWEKLYSISDAQFNYVDILIKMGLYPYNEKYIYDLKRKDDYSFVIDFIKKNNLIPNKMGRWDGSFYMGKRYDDYYILYSHNRDSNLIEESNYETIKESLKNDKINFIEIVSSHFLVGWIEQIGIHEDDLIGIEKANDILVSLEGYPIFDEEDFSKRQYEKALEIEQEIKKDLRNRFQGNKLNYEEKKEYAKRIWFNLELNKGGSIKEIAERSADDY